MAAAPAIVAGLRISFGSALVAVVPAEMLLGELGIGYLSWIEWNNLDISGVIFAILRDVSRLPQIYSAHERLVSLQIRILGAIVNGTDGPAARVPPRSRVM